MVFFLFIISCAHAPNKTTKITETKSSMLFYIYDKKAGPVYISPSIRSKLLIKLPYSCAFKIIGKSLNKNRINEKWLKIEYGTYIRKIGWILNPKYVKNKSLDFQNIRFVNSLNGLNLRSRPSINSKIIKSLPYLAFLYVLQKHASISFLKEQKYHWLKVALYKNGRIIKQGWVADLFLQKQFHPNVIYLNDKTKGIRWVYSSNGLNLRKEANIKSKVVRSLHFKERVEPIALTKNISIINGKKGRWLYIKHIDYIKNKINFGWVFNAFIISSGSFMKKSSVIYGTYYLKKFSDADYNHDYKKAYIKLFKNGKYFYFIEGLNGQITKYTGNFSLISGQLIFDNLGIKFHFTEKNGDIILSDMKSMREGNVYVKVN